MYSDDDEVEKTSAYTFSREGDEIISVQEVCLDSKLDKKFLEFNSTNTLLPNLNKNDMEIPIFRDVFPEDLESQQASFEWTEEDGNIADLVSEPGFGTTGQTSFGKDLDAVLADSDLKMIESSKKKRLKRERSLSVSSTAKQQMKSLLCKGKPVLRKVDKNDPRSRFHYVKYLKRLGRTLKIWECGICCREFQHQYTLMRHLPTHTDERKYSCDFCGKSFRQLSTLSQHKAIHSSDRPFACEMCNKTFNRVSTLISHRKTHTDDKPYKCHLCPKGFHQKGNLRNHLFTHTNERPYRCSVCDKGFNQQSNLVCHKNKSHPEQCTPEELADYSTSLHNNMFGSKNKNKNVIREGPLILSIPLTSTNKSKDWSISSDTDISWHQPECRETGFKSDKKHNLLPSSLPSNGVVVDKIKTYCMQVAIASKQTPFALLKPDSGSPVLVKVVDIQMPEGKQMLVPATAEDLRHGGKIVKSGEDSKISVPVVAVVEARVLRGVVQLHVKEPRNDYHTALALDGEVSIVPCTMPENDALKFNSNKTRTMMPEQPRCQPKPVKVIKLPCLKKFDSVDVNNADSTLSSPPLVLPLDMTTLDMFQAVESVETITDEVLECCSLQDNELQSLIKSPANNSKQTTHSEPVRSNRKPLKVIKLPCLKKINDIELLSITGEPSGSVLITEKDVLASSKESQEPKQTKLPEQPRSQRKPLKVIKLPCIQKLNDIEIIDTAGTSASSSSSSSPPPVSSVSSLSTIDMSAVDFFHTIDTTGSQSSSLNSSFSVPPLSYVGADLFNERLPNIIDLPGDFDPNNLPIKIEGCFI